MTRVNIEAEFCFKATTQLAFSEKKSLSKANQSYDSVINFKCFHEKLLSCEIIIFSGRGKRSFWNQISERQ